MSNTTKTIIAILILGVAIFVFFRIRSCNASTPDVIASTDSTVQYWETKLGDTVASLKKRQEDYNVIRDGFWLDSIASIHKTKTNYIKEVVTVTQKGEVIIKSGDPIIVRDTVLGEIDYVQQTFNNEYYDAEVFIPMNGDSSTLALQTRDTLSVVWKTVKEGGLFNRKTYLQIDVTNANPYNNISGLQAYRQPAPKPSAWNRWIKPVLVGAATGYVGYQIGRKL